mmetsp:Transcript_89278/g.251255  ORF Transcript_89278/g.251255 Transcript_89278/m.251255 type:complete len:110 (+) Transcript_89278:1304-1633(+)
MGARQRCDRSDWAPRTFNPGRTTSGATNNFRPETSSSGSTRPVGASTPKYQNLRIISTAAMVKVLRTIKEIAARRKNTMNGASARHIARLTLAEAVALEAALRGEGHIR